MSTKRPFLTHGMNNAGKKTKNLPVTDATCKQNSSFVCMTDTAGAQPCQDKSL